MILYHEHALKILFSLVDTKAIHFIFRMWSKVEQISIHLDLHRIMATVAQRLCVLGLNP